MESDVLCGRGGETNHHPGNVKYRALVKRFQPLYIVSKRRDKPRIAEKIVRTIRQRGGRFLKKDSNSNTWRDVGNTKAREKTSQALREGAPELRSTPKGREEPPFPVPKPLVMKSYADRPSSSVHSPPLVEADSGDVMRRDVASAGFAASSPASPKRRRVDYATAQAPLVAAGIVTPSPHPIETRFCVQMPSSSGFSATVSADDEDVLLRQPNPLRSTRGPRLKLLKKRLQHDKSL